MTQTEPAAFGGPQIMGMVIGVSLVAVAFFVIASFNRRARVARRERPPLKTKILRPCGYALQRRIDELTEKWNEAVMQAVVAGSMLGILGSAIYPIVKGIIIRQFTWGQLWMQPKSYLLISLAALTLSAMAWIIVTITYAVRLQGNLRDYRFGLRGEQVVAEALGDCAIAAAGYVVFHDVPGDGPWNIDHVVVGPGGIFVLETKTRSRRKSLWDQPEQKVYYDGQRLRFPWCEDRRVVRQVEQNAKWVRQFVSGFAPNNILIQPVIVAPGWFVESQGAYPVHAMNAEYLIDYIAKSKPRYANEELRGVMGRLDERCRDVEF